MEDLPNFSLTFDLPASSEANKSNEKEPQKARFQNLSEQELEKILAERHSARTQKAKNWSVSTFKGKHHCFCRAFLLHLLNQRKIVNYKITKQSETQTFSGNFHYKLKHCRRNCTETWFIQSVSHALSIN